MGPQVAAEGQPETHLTRPAGWSGIGARHRRIALGAMGPHRSNPASQSAGAVGGANPEHADRQRPFCPKTEEHEDNRGRAGSPSLRWGHRGRRTYCPLPDVPGGRGKRI